MKAKKAIELMRNSELKTFSIKDDNKIVLEYINSGIFELHRKFSLWDDYASITMSSGVSLYKLDGTDPNVTIDLTNSKFIMAEQLYDPDNKFYLQNDSKDAANIEHSVSTPKNNHFKFYSSEIVPGYVIEVRYRAAPVDLTSDTEEIDLPEALLDPLYLFCVYKAQMSIKSGGDRDLVNAALKRFEAACARVKFEGAITQDHLETNKFSDRGFV